ncbi:hypothetical protein F4780DRAFT_779823 [Xylariomycetidae sp. FL0641]|nr:hypothetical protein F4780DRAFT_779823 [Xylariomycetidae sp. FL0641]
MAEPQPPTVHEGATTGDVSDEVAAAKNAEDRKAAAAMASLDSRADENAGSGTVDAAAAQKAMQDLGGEGAKTAAVAPKVKVDAADVALLVDELDLTKAKATELLKAHEGDAVRAMKAFIAT